MSRNSVHATTNGRLLSLRHAKNKIQRRPSEDAPLKGMEANWLRALSLFLGGAQRSIALKKETASGRTPDAVAPIIHEDALLPTSSSCFYLSPTGNLVDRSRSGSSDPWSVTLSFRTKKNSSRPPTAFDRSSNSGLTKQPVGY